MYSMKKIALSLFACSLIISAFGQNEPPPPERIILNDLLSEINKKEISTHIRILEKVNKFILLPAENTTKPADFKAFQANLKNTALFIPASGKPLVHNQVPTKAEMDNPTINMNVAKNQKTFSVFGVVTANELKNVNVSVSELKGNNGNIFPADKIKFYFLKNLMITSDQYIFRPYPFGMQPVNANITLHKV